MAHKTPHAPHAPAVSRQMLHIAFEQVAAAGQPRRHALQEERVIDADIWRAAAEDFPE